MIKNCILFILILVSFNSYSQSNDNFKKETISKYDSTEIVDFIEEFNSDYNVFYKTYDMNKILSYFTEDLILIETTKVYIKKNATTISTIVKNNGKQSLKTDLKSFIQEVSLNKNIGYFTKINKIISSKSYGDFGSIVLEYETRISQGNAITTNLELINFSVKKVDNKWKIYSLISIEQ